MFNGIIFNQGKVIEIKKRDKGINIFIYSNIKVSKKDLGISIACDGVCLTLISYNKRILEFYLQMKPLINLNLKKLNLDPQ